MRAAHFIGTIRTLALAAALAAAWLGAAFAAEPEVLASEPVPTATLHVAAGEAVALSAQGPVERVVIANPETASVGEAGPRDLYVIGRGEGPTNVLVYGRDGRLGQVIDVQVGSEARTLQAQLAEALPGEPIEVVALNQGLLLRGSVSSSEAEAVALRLAERAAPDAVHSRLDVRPTQVQLEVRIVEASAQRIRDLGAGLSLIGAGVTLSTDGRPIGPEPSHASARVSRDFGTFTLDARLAALERRGEVRLLARPTLVTLSGQSANFRAGGEFPFPIPQDEHAVTVAFRPYGTALAFKPDVQSNGLIRLSLAAEVSDLDARNSLSVQGVVVPALSIRRAQTVAEVRDGQTLVFAGLFEDEIATDTRRTPILASLPGVGRLFGAGRGRRAQHELAIMVTAHLVSDTHAPPPVADEAALLADPLPPPPRTLADRGRGLLHSIKALPRLAWREARRLPGQALRLARALPLPGLRG
jgi:pilus assembly protein CpaC